MSEHVVIVGASVGGVRTAQSLRQLGFDGEITVVGEEAEQPYDKPPLSKQLLVGAQSEADVALLGSGGFAGIGAEGRLGTRAVGLDTDRMLVHLDDGEAVGYDALVIATGVRPRALTGAAAGARGRPVESDAVTTVRRLRDARALAARATAGPVVVVGAGFIGAEVASSFRSLGAEVTMTEGLAVPFARAVGERVGAHLAQMHRDHGVDLITDAAVAAIEPTRDGAVVRLADGRVREAATVVVGIGTAPNTEWLAHSGLALDDGVLVDSGCAVETAESVYAVGDVARRLDPARGGYHRVEHWTSATEQAHLVARQLIEPLDATPVMPAPYFWSDQFGTKIQMVGLPGQATRVELAGFGAGSAGRADRTVALYEAGGRLVAAVTFGWPRAVAACRRALAEGADLDDVRARLADLAGGVRVAAPLA